MSMNVYRYVCMNINKSEENNVAKSIFNFILFGQRGKQIHIIALLSGLSLGDDEAIVRASAVRALAIFVMFPSLKEG